MSTVRWQACPGAPPIDPGFDPEAAATAAAPLKENLVRTVVPCTVGGTRAVLKIHRSRSAWDRLKHRWAPKGKMEAGIARRLRARGAPAIEPLASGSSPADSYLLMREIPGARSLHDAGPGLSPRERRILSKRLGHLLESAHRAHLWHPDLHAGNVLVSPGPDGGPWLTVADLPSARLLPGIPPRLVVRSLAMLAASLPFFSRADLLRGLKAYAGREGKERRRRWVREILQERDRIGDTHWRSRTKRCTRTTGAFIRSRFQALNPLNEHVIALTEKGPLPPTPTSHHTENGTGNSLLVHRRELDGPLLVSESHIAHFMSFKNSDRPLVVKKDTRTSVVCLSHTITNSPNSNICVKIFHDHGLKDRLRRLTSLTRARRAWIAANALWERECATAKPLAFIEDNAEYTGYLVTEDLSPARELDRFLAERWPGMAPDIRRRFLKNLAKAFRKLGERGVWPGDAKTCNLFVQEKNNGFAFPLVDVDGVRQRRPSTTDLSKTLAQLHLSAPRTVGRLSRARFLKELTGGAWRSYAQLALRMTRGRKILYQSDAGDVTEDQP